MLSTVIRFSLLSIFGLCIGIGMRDARAASTAGTIQFSAATYATSRTAGTVVLKVERLGGSTGAAHARVLTHAGTALDGIHFMRDYEWVSWADGNAATKTVTVKIVNKTFTGTLDFTVGLDFAGGASLGSPSTATVAISGSTITTVTPSAGVLEFSAASYSVSQTAGSVTINVSRKAGSTGAASAHYSTSNETAVSGKDYKATSGVLNWANGDAAAKSLVVPLISNAAFSGAKTLTVSLSSPTVASLSAPSSTTVSIAGTAVSTANCARSSSSWVTTGAWTSKQFGDYFVNNNNWGGTPGQTMWANSASCWGVTTTATSDVGSIRSYPSVTRGWSQNGSILDAQSTPGTSDWTVKSGMGVAVTKLTKAKIHWAFSAPTTRGIRWMGLQDIYFHKTATPAYTEFPPVVDLMIDQALADQVVNSTTYYALVAQESHATTISVGGSKYMIYVDNPGEAGYHQAGGHTVHLFNLPTSYTSNNGNTLWGEMNAVNDVAAIVRYLMQSNPLDDAGLPLHDASGKAITAPLIAGNLYLNAINAGWEIDDGTAFVNDTFCVAMQGEPDCK